MKPDRVAEEEESDKKVTTPASFVQLSLIDISKQMREIHYFYRLKIVEKMKLFLFYLCILLCGGTLFGTAHGATTPINVGVVLDLDILAGIMGLSCVDMALSDFYASHSHFNTRILLYSRNSKSDVVGAAAAALNLMKNLEVQAIIGPLTSMEANFIIGMGEKAQVPIISFTATSPSLTSLQSSYFFRTTHKDSSQVKAITAIVQAFGWRIVVPIYEDDSFGEGWIPYLADALQEVDARIPYRSVIPQTASDDRIALELYKLTSMETRVFVVHMTSNLSSRLFTKAKEIGMMSKGYVWIITDAVTNILPSLNPSLLDSMQGVIGVRNYVPASIELENFAVRWRRKFQQDNPTIDNPQLNVFGLWGYDTAWALAMAVEAVQAGNLSYQKANSSINGTDLENIGVSQKGREIRDALANTTFKGLSGEFRLVNGQLQSPTFEIVNINGRGGRVVGFWTTQKGLTKTLNLTGKNSYSTSADSLGPIIWPGESTSVPKGWDVPTNRKKLRVGVPVKDGFSEFVTVKFDSVTNTTKVSGYCIDVFMAVLEELPYAIVPEFIPFAKPNNKMAGTYDDLVYQVSTGTFDAVVGDTTIVANRSLYVDFTLPFTESGVSMVVPIEDNNKRNAWVFLKPLTWDLWLTSGCFFVFIGFVVWILEHRINEDFRGPPIRQFGTSLWFSFSTMVFAPKEMVYSNLARIVVVIWFFVVLILTQSYTASLTSLLTVQQLQPTITDFHQLLKSGDRVGYQVGSFVPGFLKSLKLDEYRLITYNSPEELNDLFIKGSGNGGISAAFDEIPYLKVFLSKYCSKYTMEEPSFKIDGFGFAFPKGSPIVADISRAILNVTEGEQMNKIESKWFGKLTSCPSTSTEITSTSLSLDSFWGLFLISGAASIAALIAFFIIFIYKEMDNLRQINSTDSVWKYTREVLKIFDQEDRAFPTKRHLPTEVIFLAMMARLWQLTTPNQQALNYPQTPFSLDSSEQMPVHIGEATTPLSRPSEPSEISIASPDRRRTA